MKKRIFTLVFLSLLLMVVQGSYAQKTVNSENYGGTLNLGLGIGGYAGYYGYIGHTMPVFHINYELNVANNLTLAPFLSFSTYRNGYYWSNGYYYYHETIIPIGLKGTYYFDQILQANSNWDFYLAGSVGFAIVKSSWDSGYNGDRNYYHNGNPLFLDLHVGTEYHLSNRLGIFLDLSTGVSTVGISLH